jgi:methyltransferase family protein
MPSPTVSDLLVPGASRFDLWTAVIAKRNVRTLAEVGVWRGAFAEAVLSQCPDIERYYLIDPWRHLDDWNKPANAADSTFDQYYEEVLERTSAWEQKRVCLRGRTTEVSDEIPNESLDFAYIDGDHSLRGISIDLVRMWPKIRDGGMLGGDDFQPSVWQHAAKFEPTVVFPFAVYFAEAVDAPIEALPRSQFVMHKSTAGFSFTDHTGRYGNLTLRGALHGRKQAAAKRAAATQPKPKARGLRRLRRLD